MAVVTEVLMIPVDQIDSEGNIRHSENDIAGLAASMDRQGQLQPITIKLAAPDTGNDDERYVVVTGHRRLAAARSIPWVSIDAIVIDSIDTEADRISAQYAENVFRKQLSAYERAQVALDLKEQGLNQKDVAAELGVSTKAVSQLQKVAKAVPQDRRVEASKLTEKALFDLVEEADGVPEIVGEAAHLIVDANETAWRAKEKAKRSYLYERFMEQAEGYVVALAEKNIDFVSMPDYMTAWMPVRAWPDKEDRVIKGKAFLQVANDEHRAESCHRVSVYESFDDFQIVEWCAEPKRHTKKGESSLKDPDLTPSKAMTSAHEQDDKEKAAKTRKDKQARKEKAAIWLELVSIKDAALEKIFDEVLDDWCSTYQAQSLVKVMEIEKVYVREAYSAKATIAKHIRDKYKSIDSRFRYLALIEHATSYVQSGGWGPERVLGKTRKEGQDGSSESIG